jgi:hypothetical protein
MLNGKPGENKGDLHCAVQQVEPDTRQAQECKQGPKVGQLSHPATLQPKDDILVTMVSGPLANASTSTTGREHSRMRKETSDC